MTPEKDKPVMPKIRIVTFVRALLAVIFFGTLVGSLFGSIVLAYRFFTRFLVF